MMALTRPTIEIYRHHLQGTGREDLVRDSVYVHVYRKAEDADLSQLGGCGGIVGSRRGRERRGFAVEHSVVARLRRQRY